VLRPLRLHGADRVEAAGQDVLQRGQRHEAAVRLAQRGQVADLAHRDQPLVGLVALGHGLEQVDLLVGGRQPGEVELSQAVHLQPLGDLRVDAADQPVLGQAGPAFMSTVDVVRTEGEAVPHGDAARARHRERDPRDRPRQC
jgi:hypothetical protein